MIVIDLGYKSYVLDKQKALQVAEILENAEVYERKYWTEEQRKSMGVDYTHHVYPNEEGFVMKLVSDSLYQMAKLAGKPTKE